MTGTRFVLLLMSLCSTTVMPSQAAPAALTGTWRFTHALPAPWGPPITGSARLSGHTLHLTTNTMQGPAPLDCGTTARLETTSVAADGLFQGVLPAPASAAAQSLGLSRFPVAGISVTCDKGLFEFHQADADTLLLALDNQVWTLSRAAGTQAAPNSPSGRVQTLLETHFNGQRALDAETAAAKVPFQSRRLNQLITAYLAKPRDPDRVPPIDGDPYTDSQEYPTRFAVGSARISKDHAHVAVRFSDGTSQRVITYVLLREQGQWLLDDLHYGHAGGRLSDLLQQ